VRRSFVSVALTLLATGMPSLAVSQSPAPSAPAPAAAPATVPAPATPPAAAAAAGAYSPQGADTCLGCHNYDAVIAIFRTKHARPDDPRGPFGHGGLQCEACHGPGGAHVQAGGGPLAGLLDFGPKASAPAVKQNAQCLSCHQSNAAHDWASSAHAASEVACASCHTLHAAKDPVQSAATQIEVCTSCHQAQHADLNKPSHHPLREGKMACTSCHSPHGSTAPAQLVRNTVNETCTTCHAEYRGPFLWEHQPVTEDCSNCHNPHGSAQPALLKMRPPFLCQTCHEGAGHPSIVNTPQGLPGGGSPSAFLLAGGCTNCHSQIHGSNHPSGRAFMR
jgi:DmsE family decaheme c-type cytochrome